MRSGAGAGAGQAWNSCDLTAFVRRSARRPRGLAAGGADPGRQRAFASACAGRRRRRVIGWPRPGRGGVTPRWRCRPVTDRLIVDRDDGAPPRRSSCGGRAPGRGGSRRRRSWWPAWPPRGPSRGCACGRAYEARAPAAGSPGGSRRAPVSASASSTARTASRARSSRRGAHRAGPLPAHAGPRADAPDSRRGRRGRRPIKQLRLDRFRAPRLAPPARPRGVRVRRGGAG